MNNWVKCIIFDLDGVLIDTHEIHLQAFMRSLQDLAPEFACVDSAYHAYGGITTKHKLDLLTREAGLPIESHAAIMARKEKYTLDLINEHVDFDKSKADVISYVKSIGMQVHIASNARRSFVDLILKRMQIASLIDGVICGDEVAKPKPHHEIFTRCILNAGCTAAETIIFDDTIVGSKAALDTRANCVIVDSINDINVTNVRSIIRNVERRNRASLTDVTSLYGHKNINVVVPMAGRGSRFTTAGFTEPKPFITVSDKWMVQQTVDVARIPGRYVFCAQHDHLMQKGDQFKAWLNTDDVLLEITSVTGGAAQTVLMAESLIDNDDPLFIVNCDQLIEWDFHRFMAETCKQHVDGGIITFEATGSQWSYAKTMNDRSNIVTEVAEKRPISTHATAGIYYWRHGRDFVKYAKQMIDKDVRTNGEFYVCPVYNEAIADGKKVVTFQCDNMLNMGTPEDLKSTLEIMSHEN